MHKHLLGIVLFFGLASIGLAADTVCEDFSKAVEAGVKEMAFYSESALGTAPLDVISRRLSLMAEASRVQSNLALMQANKCPMPKTPIDPRTYFESAFACAHVVSKAGTAPIPECDRDKWKKVIK